MNATKLVCKFLEDSLVAKIGQEDTIEAERIDVLRIMLSDTLYVLEAMRRKFPLEDAPEEVYLFDTDRNQFWKAGGRGYTRDIYQAGLYRLSEARLSINEDLDSYTKIVYFD